MPPTSRRTNSALSCQNGSKSEFELGFARICTALGFRSQVRLAEILGICQSSISDASKRGVIPGEWVLKLYRTRRLNPLWVYDGLLPVFLENQAQRGSPGGEGMSSFLLGYASGSLTCFQMRDASMEPLVPRDCFVGIDSSNRNLAGEGFHGVDLPLEGRTVRTLRLENAQGPVSLHAADPAVPVQRMSLAEARTRLVGRVAWVMRRV